MVKSGIYIIENTQSGKVYIGSSKDIEGRWKRHCKVLRNGNHDNEHFQRAWDKYGEEAFVFDVLWECEPEECERIEKKALKIFETERGWDNLYNICSCTDSPPSQLGIRRSPGFRARLSVSLTGRKLSQEHKTKIGVAHKGMKRSSEAKAKMCKSWTPKRRVEQSERLKRNTYAKGNTNWTGKKHSEATKVKISVANRGEKPFHTKAAKRWEKRRRMSHIQEKRGA